jgi:hypothetical protein
MNKKYPVWQNAIGYAGIAVVTFFVLTLPHWVHF